MINNDVKKAMETAVRNRVNDSKWYFVECGWIPQNFSIIDYVVLATSLISDASHREIYPLIDGDMIDMESEESVGNWLQDGVYNFQVCVENTNYITRFVMAIMTMNSEELRVLLPNLPVAVMEDLVLNYL